MDRGEIRRYFLSAEYEIKRFKRWLAAQVKEEHAANKMYYEKADKLTSILGMDTSTSDKLRDIASQEFGHAQTLGDISRRLDNMKPYVIVQTPGGTNLTMGSEVTYGEYVKECSSAKDRREVPATGIPVFHIM